MAGRIPLLIPSSTINNIPVSVNSSNFNFVILEAACHANPSAEQK